ncbi:hypothetical protein AMS68_000976 [Peltaster fructicola]|uniref:Phosphatidylserine decarboxylase proenzyme 2 n=1 Tax=Peltaster fructicola TaxID=286661 RepID=A0A6H0XLF3_9PEZI|nr:hypothetical protein AMS68_000976 [Peltaster fructicola]
MPRPHIPHHLSLHRFKSHGDSSQAGSTQTPGTPPISSRGPSPARTPRNGSGELGDQKDMGLTLRVMVMKARNLAPKDKSGTSDPYMVITLGEAKQATSAVSKTLNPEWNQTFEFSVNSADSALLEAVCWDKDRFRKDYMGEFDIILDEIFTAGTTMPEPRWFKLESRMTHRKQKKDADVSGEVLLKFTLFDPLDTTATPQHVLQKFHGLTAETGDSSMADDALLAQVDSQDPDDAHYDEDEDDKIPAEGPDDAGRTAPQESTKSRRRQRIRALKQRSKQKTYEFGGMSDVAGVLFLEINRITDLPPEKNMTRTSFDMDPFVVISLGKKTYRTRVIRHNLNPVFDEKLVFQVLKNEVNFSLNFSVVDRDKFSGNDFVGTASFPMDKITAVSPEADRETGLYKLADPDNVERERRKRFRLPLSRGPSQINIGQLSRNSSQNNLKMSRTTSNTSLKGLSTTPSRVDNSTYDQTRMPPPLTSEPSSISTKDTSAESSVIDQDDADLNVYEIPLDLKNKARWEDKHNPTLYVKAKYLPYRALRQQFWRAMLRQYDADESGKMDKVEFVTMLDTLGSTLRNKTIDGFFERFKAVNNGEDVLTMDQAIICLEEQLQKSQDGPTGASWKTKIRGALKGDHAADVPAPKPANLDPNASSVPTLSVQDLGAAGEQGDALPDDDDLLANEGDADLGDPESREERVVQIHECPICHQPRLTRSKKTDSDIIVHIATCASADWRAVNNLVMAGFVTSSQAQRKWYSKVITKVSYGGYRLGANSANILVQDRLTGMINEERMSVYVRLGIRLLYKGLKSRNMENDKIRKLLRSLSFKQGRKYDDPSSASQIPGFINFHQLDMGEVLLPTSDFKNFNEFFYRQLKPDARPCSAPDDPHIIVSPADCRSVVFNRLDDAQRIWVKGRDFSVERLLGNAYPEDAKRFKNGALGIARLAPQDYHRFHIPVDGVMGEPKLIEGEYYTVNPMAIRSALDVYGENIRVVVPIDSAVHGRVMVICVGAMMVGSTVITRKAGEQVKRAEELGYFKFGGSTILLLFQPGVMQFDDDLVANSDGALETLIRVGMAIGSTVGHESYKPDLPKSNPSQAEKQEAKRRIEGSLAPRPTT